MDNTSIRKLEAKLWEAADYLRSNSPIRPEEYRMPVLGLIFLRYAYSRFVLVKGEIESTRKSRNGRVMPVEESDFKERSALYLPNEAQYPYLLNLPENIASLELKTVSGNAINSLGEAVNYAMELVEAQSEQLKGVLPKNYTMFPDDLLGRLLRVFNNDLLNDVGGDVFGRIYEYFLNKFAPKDASGDGVFFTPKSLVKMIVNVLEPKRGTVLDPACGSGGMFVQTGDFVGGSVSNQAMTFYGQEKVPYNAHICLMNLAVHGLNGIIRSGDEANTFYHDAHNLDEKCDYVMANPPFNSDKVKSKSALAAGRLPFGLPAVNKAEEINKANYLWISYFYSYLNETGRAGFVMAASATDSQIGRDADIREQLVKTGDVDVMMSVGNNFFYTKSLPCSLWFFDKGKSASLRDYILFINAEEYYTVVDKNLNEWSEWQLKNLNAVVWLYRGEVEKYKTLLSEYCEALGCSGSFPECLSALESDLAALQAQAKAAVEAATKKERKGVQARFDEMIATLQEKIRTAHEAVWLYEKFGEGVYADVPGFCKIASLKEIEEKNWSLTPGAYVGVAPVEDDGVDFGVRMAEIHAELVELQAESNALMEKISENWKGLRV